MKILTQLFSSFRRWSLNDIPYKNLKTNNISTSSTKIIPKGSYHGRSKNFSEINRFFSANQHAQNGKKKIKCGKKNKGIGYGSFVGKCPHQTSHHTQTTCILRTALKLNKNLKKEPIRFKS